MAAMMAAMNFALRNLCLISLLFSSSLSLFHHVGTAEVNALQPVSCWIPRLHFICRRDLPSYKPSRPIAIWNKRAFVCLLLPSTELTIFVDVERNPGLYCSSLNNMTHSTTSSCNVLGLDQGHQKYCQFSCISYKRNQVLFLRHRVSTAVRLHFWGS